jgi:hypothetical protein
MEPLAWRWCKCCIRVGLDILTPNVLSVLYSLLNLIFSPFATSRAKIWLQYWSDSSIVLNLLYQ